ncbi:hypothetical protein HOY80DRAFT_1023181 [Tuber brumale]|nr:hypothetical protein HOY80DRAFT_1023181 [Tuber brumale]
MSTRLHYPARDGYLRLVMPTELHECPVAWMGAECGKWLAHRRLSLANLYQIRCWKPTCDSFMGDYAGSCINNVRRDYSSVILESGLSESDTQLMSDSLPWLEGTGGAVRVVVLCKTFAPDEDKKIKAILSMYPVFATGQSVRPGPGRGRTTFRRPVPSFCQHARQVRMKDEDGQHCVIPSRLFSNLPDSLELRTIPPGVPYRNVSPSQV